LLKTLGTKRGEEVLGREVWEGGRVNSSSFSNLLLLPKGL